MGSFSIWHWLIVLLVVVLIFGTKKLKNMGSDLGGAVKGFKDGVKDGTASSAADADAPPQQVDATAKAGRRQHGRRRGEDQVVSATRDSTRVRTRAMIDFGFDKIALIGAVALIVIGPEKLPRVARTVGHLLGKAQRYVADVKAEVNRSIELEELQEDEDAVRGRGARRRADRAQARSTRPAPTLETTLEQTPRRACADGATPMTPVDAAAARRTSTRRRTGASSAAPRRSGTSSATASAPGAVGRGARGALPAAARAA